MVSLCIIVFRPPDLCVPLCVQWERSLQVQSIRQLLRTSSCYCHIQMTASSLRHFLTHHAAGSRDRDARVWNTNNAPTTACMLTLTGHDEAVTCVHAAHLGPMGTGPGQMG